MVTAVSLYVRRGCVVSTDCLVCEQGEVTGQSVGSCLWLSILLRTPPECVDVEVGWVCLDSFILGVI